MVIRNDMYGGFTKWEKKQMKKEGRFPTQRLGDFGSSMSVPGGKQWVHPDSFLNPANYTLLEIGEPKATNTLPPSGSLTVDPPKVAGMGGSLLEGNNKYYLAGAAALALFFVMRKKR